MCLFLILVFGYTASTARTCSNHSSHAFITHSTKLSTKVWTRSTSVTLISQNICTVTRGFVSLSLMFNHHVIYLCLFCRVLILITQKWVTPDQFSTD